MKREMSAARWECQNKKKKEHRKCESVELFCRLIIHHPHIRWWFPMPFLANISLRFQKKNQKKKGRKYGQNTKRLLATCVFGYVFIRFPRAQLVRILTISPVSIFYSYFFPYRVTPTCQHCIRENSKEISTLNRKKSGKADQKFHMSTAGT